MPLKIFNISPLVIPLFKLLQKDQTTHTVSVLWSQTLCSLCRGKKISRCIKWYALHSVVETAAWHWQSSQWS